MDWEVVVFDEDSVNAFADLNGKIGVFTGLLDVADTPDALATVIGHEVCTLSKVIRWHWRDAVCGRTSG